MKRTFRIFLFAAILAAFLMGCSPLLPVSPSGEPSVPSEPSAPPATTAPTEEPAPTFDDSVLGEAYTNVHRRLGLRMELFPAFALPAAGYACG